MLHARAAQLVAVSMRMKVTEKRLAKYEAEYEEVKAEEMAATDPLVRSQDKCAELQATVLRLETESSELAHTLVSGKIDMQKQIDQLDVELNTAKRENERLNALVERISFEAEDDKTRLELESTQSWDRPISNCWL